MAIAQFVKTEILDTTDQTKSIAVVDIDGKERRVEFWYSILGQYSKEEVRELLCGDALAQAGFIADARALIGNGAEGSLTRDEDGKVIDTRNWRQNWLDANPLPPQPIEPENDPLL